MDEEFGFEMTLKLLDSRSVSSLVQLCLSIVAEKCNKNYKGMFGLPNTLKDRLLHLMSKRGLVSDKNIGCLIHKNTKIIDVSECSITDEALFAINKCENLRKFCINSTKENNIHISELGFKSVARCSTYLQIIHVGRCLSITDEVVIAFSKYCPLLFEINITGCYLITDKALKSLGNNSHCLQRINFSKTKVTDKGVSSLVKNNCSCTLEEILMEGCLNVTDKAVEAIMKNCKNIQIIIFHNCPQISEQSRVMLEEFTGPNSKLRQVMWTVY